VTGYQKSKCSSKLVAEMTTKIANKQYGDRQMKERQRKRRNFSNGNKSAENYILRTVAMSRS